MKVAVVTPVAFSGERGGAENLYQGLVKGLRQNGVKVDQIKIAVNESSIDDIKRAYLDFYDLDLSAYDGVISTKAPSYLVRHPNHICYLLHTMRSFYDMFDLEFPRKTRPLIQQRQLIQRLDTGALSYPRTKKIITIGEEVRQRLKKWNGLESRVLWPALPAGRFHCNRYQFLFVPSRLHRWKRIDLVIRAMSYVDTDIRVKIAGTGEDENRFRELARGDARIEFLGWVTQRKLGKLYANALAVIFAPLREDFGFVTAEAFASAKPVITCSDSGEPARLVRDGLTGFICRPNPKSLAKKIEILANDSGRAQLMGEKARATAPCQTWTDVGRGLLAELELEA